MGKMFKKPKRNFRRRQDSEDVEEEDSGMAPVQPPQHVKKEKKKKKKEKEEGLPKSSSGANMLSFEDEGEGEIFQVKKSSHSKRIYKQLKKESKREQEERLKREEEERKRHNTDTRGDKVQPVAMDVSGESSSSSDHPKSPSPLGSDYSDEEDDQPKHEYNKPTFNDILRSGGIPDANMIHLAKKTREAARERGEFIPVDNSAREEAANSRLVRDDDNDKSDDEEERISFQTQSRHEELKRMESKILAVEEGSHSEDSEHEGEWEKQQILKGTGTFAPLPTDSSQTRDQSAYYSQANSSAYTNASGNNGLSVGYQSMPVSDETPTISTIQSRLRERLDELRSVHRAHVNEKDDLESRLETCEEAIDKYGGGRKELEENYNFYQEMRMSCRDLVSCYDEKMSSIAYIERCLNTLWKKRAEKIIKRRQEDIKDQEQEFKPSKAVTGVALAATANEDADEARRSRKAEREARRNRRRRVRETLSITNHHDGFSTDEEERTADILKQKTERDRLAKEAVTMFDDTLDEFHDFSAIKQRFEKWKWQHTDSYEEAFIGLCLPRLFTPLVRTQLISWNPLEENCKDFEEMGWYETLMFYGHKDEVDPPEDQDLVLLPSIIEKVVMPKVTNLVENVWDPMSGSQTKRMVMLVRKLVTDYPLVAGDSKSVPALMKALAVRMRKAIDEDIFIPLYSKTILENKNAPATMFFHRQFWSTVKLLGNILSWDGLVADSTIKELALDGLLNRYLILALLNSAQGGPAITKCQAIAGSFPRSWFNSLLGDSTLPQLENFCRYILSVARSFDKGIRSQKDSERREARDNIKQITKILVNIHATNHALTLGDEFSFKV